uniref:Ig-like domain-containing protein n=1 Tax=Apteryx owenii TaxID=8824 RepID=A0A8B9P7U3_APTOW
DARGSHPGGARTLSAPDGFARSPPGLPPAPLTVASRRRSPPPLPAVTAKKPVVYSLTPCPCEENNVTLACLVSDYFPEPAIVTWVSNAPYSTSTYPAAVGSDSLYSLSSQLTTPLSNLDGNNIKCTVQHILSPSCFSADICPVPSNDGENPAPVGRPAQRCSLRPDIPLMVVELQPPSLEDLFLSQNASITCVASNVKVPGDVTFSWKRQKAGTLDVVPGQPTRQDNGLYRLTSVLKVCADEWNSGETFTCTVASPELAVPVTKSAKKDIGRTNPVRAPSVYVFAPPAEELALEETATLTCLATGFSPRDVLVTWTQQERPVPSKSFAVFGPEEDAGAYTVYSKLSVPWADWQRGDSFACVVGHEGLPITFVQKSLDKASGKPASVNVSVVLADADITCY